MNVCLDCFKKSPEENSWEFYNRRDTLYVKMTKRDLKCDVCHQKKPVIAQAIRKLMDPYNGNPPPGWIVINESNTQAREKLNP